MRVRRSKLRLSPKAALQEVFKRWRRKNSPLYGKIEFPSVEDCADWYTLVDEIGRILVEEDAQCAV